MARTKFPKRGVAQLLAYASLLVIAPEATDTVVVAAISSHSPREARPFAAALKEVVSNPGIKFGKIL